MIALTLLALAIVMGIAIGYNTGVRERTFTDPGLISALERHNDQYKQPFNSAGFVKPEKQAFRGYSIDFQYWLGNSLSVRLSEKELVCCRLSFRLPKDSSGPITLREEYWHEKSRRIPLGREDYEAMLSMAKERWLSEAQWAGRLKQDGTLERLERMAGEVHRLHSMLCQVWNHMCLTGEMHSTTYSLSLDSSKFPAASYSLTWSTGDGRVDDMILDAEEKGGGCKRYAFGLAPRGMLGSPIGSRLSSINPYGSVSQQHFILTPGKPPADEMLREMSMLEDALASFNLALGKALARMDAEERLKRAEANRRRGEMIESSRRKVQEAILGKAGSGGSSLHAVPQEPPLAAGGVSNTP